MNQQRMLLVAVGCIVVWCSSSSLAEQNHPTTYDDLNDLTKSRQKRAWLTPLVSDSVYAVYMSNIINCFYVVFVYFSWP